MVESPPRAPRREGPSRMRTHVEGALLARAMRVWVGPEVPRFVELMLGTRELFLLDRAPEGLLALYRDPYDASSCTLGGAANCAYTVRLHDPRGDVLWSHELGDLFSRPDHLELQDIRYADGTLYFNEACQSYSRQAGGRCSSLVAVDPREGRVLWRTRPKTSNGVFLVLDRYIVAGYGFTAEPDFLFVVRRSDGRIMARTRLGTAHEALEVGEDGVLHVRIYPGEPRRFRMVGFDGDAPRIVPLR